MTFWVVDNKKKKEHLVSSILSTNHFPETLYYCGAAAELSGLEQEVFNFSDFDVSREELQSNLILEATGDKWLFYFFSFLGRRWEIKYKVTMLNI